jgi:hypothetical protein
VEPCLPAIAAGRPPGADWVHEIEYDSYRLTVSPSALHDARRMAVNFARARAAQR